MIAKWWWKSKTSSLFSASCSCNRISVRTLPVTTIFLQSCPSTPHTCHRSAASALSTTSRCMVASPRSRWATLVLIWTSTNPHARTSASPMELVRSILVAFPEAQALVSKLWCNSRNLTGLCRTLSRSIWIFTGSSRIKALVVSATLEWLRLILALSPPWTSLVWIRHRTSSTRNNSLWMAVKRLQIT